MRPSLHTNFFSSLKQVEKRLKLENSPQSSNFSSPPQHNNLLIESLSSPLYVNLDQPNSTHISSLQESEPPQQFLSNSIDFPPTHEDPPQPNSEKHQQTINEVPNNALDEIDLLFQLLGLSDNEEGGQERVCLGLEDDCDDEFYSKIARVKGPKCGKEVERLEGWIKHFLNDGGEGKIEPLRLAHLILGKAAFVSENSDNFGGLQFPSTIEEFLQNDPHDKRNLACGEAVVTSDGKHKLFL